MLLDSRCVEGGAVSGPVCSPDYLLKMNPEALRVLRSVFPVENPLWRFSDAELIEELRRRKAIRVAEVRREKAARAEFAARQHAGHLDARWVRCVRRWASKHGGKR